MKILLSLSLLAIILSGCNSGEEASEENSLFDRYNENNEAGDETINDKENIDEDENIDSVGPKDIPADLVPSR